MRELAETEIKQVVRRRYAELAVLNKSCCGPELVGEPGDVPKESVASAASCGSPTRHARLGEGEVVLDLGSGGGIDVFQASKFVGPKGKVIGVDSTPEMIFKARELARKYGYGNVEFRLGEIEHLPVESNSVDVVISNCVLNLVPDKTLAFKEVYRVLKPKGRIAVSDMNATEPTKDKEIDPENWAACIEGAITMDEYEDLLRNTGFQNIKALDENHPINQECCSKGIPVKSVTWLASKPT
jgi:arsenite methyltransferase